MKNAQPEAQKYTFVVFNTGEAIGRMAMPQEGYNPQKTIEALQAYCGSSTKIIAVLERLTLNETAGLNVIFENVADIKIKTKEDVERLLRFSIPSEEPDLVRSALSDAVPGYLGHLRGNLQHLPLMQKLFQLYAAVGNDRSVFEEEAALVTATLNPQRRPAALAIFHEILLNALPAVKRRILESN